MALLLLNSGQANAVRSKPTPRDELNPIPLSDGSYLLGEEVLADPAHAAHRGLLNALPRTTHEAIKDLLPQGFNPGAP